MNRNRFVVVGLGNIGKALLRRLSKEYDVLCVDKDPEAVEAAQAIRGDAVEVVTGDATSRLVLEEARVEDADAVILAMSSEKINVEVARVLAEQFAVGRVISVGITEKGKEALEALGVEVESLFAQAGNALRNRIEQRSKEVHGVGLGKGEILEVEVHPNSRLANKPLRLLAAGRWRVGIIYREGNIIVPRPDTVLKGRDRLIALGEPSVLRTVSEMLTFQFERFPLEYGPTVTVYLTGREGQDFFEEIGYLFSVFPLERLVILRSESARGRDFPLPEKLLPADREERVVGGPPLEAIARALSEGPDRRGIVAIRKPPARRLPIWPELGRKRFLQELSHAVDCPVLLAAGTHPYRSVAVPCVAGVDVQQVLETVFEMGALLNSETSALFVRPSRYLSSEEDVEGFENRRRLVNQLSLIYKTRAEARILEGNPVAAALASLGDAGLLAVDAAGWKARGLLSSLLDPDPIWHIVDRSHVSTLLIPQEEEAL